jgi:hypothetical protein
METEVEALRARLIEAEQELAELPALRAERDELRAMQASLSWRLTSPLRKAGALAARELVPRARLTVKRLLLRVAPRLRP